MSQFDHEAVKGTDVEGDQELEDDAVQDVTEEEGAKVGNTVEEVAPETS